MLIKCEKCKSAFNLNESLLKKDGSKVKCSVCKNVFTVYPMAPEIPEDLIEEYFIDTEETVALDTPPDMEGLGTESPEPPAKGGSFLNAFEDAMEDEADDDISIPGDEEDEDIQEDDPEMLFEEEESDQRPRVEPQSKRKLIIRILLISGMIVFLLFLTALMVFYLAPNILPDSIYSHSSATQEPSNDAGVNKLDLKDVSNDFFSSDKEGQLFVIKGTVVNNDTKARSFIQLKGDIRDETGGVLKQETAYAGNSLTDQQLKTMSMEDIKKSMQNKTGANNSNINIKQGGRVPFMIVFKDIPDNAKESWAEAIASSYYK